MKCIKSIKQTKQVSLGQIIRTSDDDAKEKVKGGYWVYIKKSEWKDVNQISNQKDNSGPKDSVTVNDELTTSKKKKGMSKKEVKQEKKRNK